MISLTFGCFHDHWGSFPVKTQLRRMKEKWKYKASHFTATAGKFKIEFQPWLLNTLIKPPSDFTEPGDFSVFFFFPAGIGLQERAPSRCEGRCAHSASRAPWSGSSLAAA